jgi:polyadenylate-binding protein
MKRAQNAFGSNNAAADDDDVDGGKKPKHSNLYVWSIPRDVDEHQLSTLFAKFGAVESCTIMRDPNTKQSKGYGFVKYVKFEDAVSAKEKLHGKYVKDKQLQIKFASTDSTGLMGVHSSGLMGATGTDVQSIPTDNVYVKGLPLDMDESSLREKFGAFGTIVSCRVIATTALIRFETVGEAEAAVREANGKMVMSDSSGGIPVSVSFNAKQQMMASLPTHSNLYVWNIPRDMEEGALKQLFEEYGEVESVNIMRDKVSQLSKGYGFVKFIRYEEAEKAIDQVSGRVLREDLAHRPLRVKFANTDSSGVVGSSGRGVGEGGGVGGSTMTTNPPSENIYIKGLPTETDENALVNAFAQFGRIVSCTRIATTGLIGFQTVEEATRAVQTANGSTLLGGSVPLLVTFKSQICRAFAQNGRCQWGHRCKFGHNRGF